MENLGRGVVAVRTSDNAVFVSWRLLGLDPAGIGFNVYRKTGEAAPVKLNAAPLTAGTNYSDTSAPRDAAHTYFVRPVVDGIEKGASGSFALKANGANEPIVRIPLNSTPEPGYQSKFLWVGDLDGDGEYDYVIDRHAPYVEGSNEDLGTAQQFLEAYRRDGTRLWRIGLGPGSLNTYNVKPGPTTLSVGMYDGATVYDLNGDGKAEVLLKVADGVTFGDGSVFQNAEPGKQFIAIVDGMTGVPLATHPFPDDFYAQAGPYGTQLGIGYADGVHPTIYFWGRNRNPDKSFNNVFASWSWNGGSGITENWVLPLSEVGNPQRPSHQMRILDVDGDGKDEVATGNFMINSDGTLRYTLAGVGHGDRFHITRFDPSTNALQGYGVQQHNPDGLLDYFYDASTGAIIWGNYLPPGSELVDVGRGQIGDIDPRFPGYEVWSIRGVHSHQTNTLAEPDSTLQPWAAHTLWWDGDLIAENLNNQKLEKWDYLKPVRSTSLRRLLSVDSAAFGKPVLANKNPFFFGDMFGDWRTEVVLMNQAHTELVIFTTNVPTDTRLYTMPHNPAYRNGLTVKGYMQAPLPDYYVGTDMNPPPVPSIRYAGSGQLAAEAATLAGGATVSGSQQGYHGNGYIAFPARGGSAEFRRVNGGLGGTARIAVRYTNPGVVPRIGTLRVNGVAQRVKFKPANGWSTLDIDVVLAPGMANTLRFESIGNGLGRIDELIVP
jgi:hypothetical protein